MERLRLFLQVVLMLCMVYMAKPTYACSPAAQIIGWKNFLLPKDVLNLQAPAGARGYQWYLNGVLSNTTASFSFSTTISLRWMLQKTFFRMAFDIRRLI